MTTETIAPCRIPGYGGVVAMSDLGAIMFVSDELDALLGLDRRTLIGRSFSNSYTATTSSR